MKVYLVVPFAEKEKAKDLGARWDSAIKSWYVPDGVDAMLFTRWLPPVWEKAKTALGRKESGKWIVGEKYIASGCDCKTPPWEVCPHSFPEYAR